MSHKRNNYKTLAENFYTDGNLEKAAELFSKSLSFEGPQEDDCLVLFNLGAIHLELGELDKAEEYNQRILHIDPEWRDALYQLGIISEEKSELEAALGYYEKAVEIDNNDIDSMYNMALLQEKLGNTSEMEKLYEDILFRDPMHFYSLNNLGAHMETLGEYDSAADYLQRSIMINPEFYLSHFNMGVVLKAKGNYSGALEEYEITGKLKPEFGSIYLNMSAIYIEMNKVEDAEKILTEGIINVPGAHDLFYNRACCYSKLGKKKAAIDDIGKALELNPYLVVWVNRDIDFDSLRKDTQFLEHRDKALEAIQKGR
jgi:tetratricopeptide (TPR) repeat protein